MGTPTFRHPELFQLLPFREWIRNNLPSGPEGVVVEDLDLVMRVYGNNYNSDDQGKFMLIELKFANLWIGIAQKKTFKLIHDLCRFADPDRQRYHGYFVLNYDNEDWDEANFKINKVDVTQAELLKFLQFRNGHIGGLWEEEHEENMDQD